MFVVLAVLLAPMIVRTTAPLPPPCNEFPLNGRVVSAGGSGVKGYAVVAIYQPRGARDTLFVWLEAQPAVVLSNYEGRFHILGRDCGRGVVRLAAAILEGNTIAATSDTILVSTLDSTEVWTTVTRPATDSCCEETVEQPVLSAYRFDVPELVIRVP